MMSRPDSSEPVTRIIKLEPKINEDPFMRRSANINDDMPRPRPVLCIWIFLRAGSEMKNKLFWQRRTRPFRFQYLAILKLGICCSARQRDPDKRIAPTDLNIQMASSSSTSLLMLSPSLILYNEEYVNFHGITAYFHFWTRLVRLLHHYIRLSTTLPRHC